MEKNLPENDVPKPLFTLNLGSNGGVVEPLTYLDIKAWLTTEVDYWTEIQGDMPSFHEDGMSENIRKLRDLIYLAEQASDQQSEEASSSRFLKHLGHFVAVSKDLSDKIQQIYSAGQEKEKFPHSLSAVGQAILMIRDKYGAKAALYFAHLHISSRYGPPNPRTIEEWFGVFAGLLQIDAKSSVAEVSLGANQRAFDLLRDEMGRFLSEKSERLEKMRSDHQGWVRRSEDSVNEANARFALEQTEREQRHAELLQTHEDKMEKIRETFRNESALHAPAEYWDKKASRHRKYSIACGLLSFGAIAGSTWFMGDTVHDVLANTKAGQTPEVWKIGFLAVLSLFVVWAIRLVVRMFLSHLHLAGDAAERVVMLKTYLSLIQDGKADSVEDRKLILQALFRPTSDGLVKDESLPTSIFEMVTRNTK